MISERHEELVSLYVIGALDSAEQAQFEAELKSSPELRQQVEQLRRVTEAYAANVPLKKPRAALREQILAALPPANVVPLHGTAPKRSAFPWTALALAACVVFAFVFINERKGRVQQTAVLSQRIQTLESLATTLQSETNLLHSRVAELRNENKFSKIRIAMLNSLLTNAPKTIAVSLWDQEKQSGVFVVRDLKPLPADRDYQLWVLDPKYPTPVDAGVFSVDAQGNVRVEFRTSQPIATPDKFAVTEEVKGGRPTPNLEKLVLIGS